MFNIQYIIIISFILSSYALDVRYIDCYKSPFNDYDFKPHFALTLTNVSEASGASLRICPGVVGRSCCSQITSLKIIDQSHRVYDAIEYMISTTQTAIFFKNIDYILKDGAHSPLDILLIHSYWFLNDKLNVTNMLSSLSNQISWFVTGSYCGACSPYKVVIDDSVNFSQVSIDRFFAKISGYYDQLVRVYIELYGLYDTKWKYLVDEVEGTYPELNFSSRIVDFKYGLIDLNSRLTQEVANWNTSPYDISGFLCSILGFNYQSKMPDYNYNSQLHAQSSMKDIHNWILTQNYNSVNNFIFPPISLSPCTSNRPYLKVSANLNAEINPYALHYPLDLVDTPEKNVSLIKLLINGASLAIMLIMIFILTLAIKVIIEERKSKAQVKDVIPQYNTA